MLVYYITCIQIIKSVVIRMYMLLNVRIYTMTNVIKWKKSLVLFLVINCLNGVEITGKLYLINKNQLIHIILKTSSIPTIGHLSNIQRW